MAILYVGDLHGKVNILGDIIQSAEAKGFTAIIQVGDFGFGFPDNCWNDFLEKRARQQKWKVPIYTCFGNHDNWNRIYQMREEQASDKVELVQGSGVYFVSRGTVLEIDNISHIFMGGAESTDKHKRVENVSWWDLEQPTHKEFELFFNNLEDQKPDTIVAHEAPLRIDLKRARRNDSYTAKTLENALKLSDHQPRNYVFGHHHILNRWKVGRTKYFCCGFHGEYWLRDDIHGGWTKSEK